MALPGGVDPGPDQLSGGLDRVRVLKMSLTVAVVGAVAIAGVVLAQDKGHHSPGRRVIAATAAPRTAAAAPATTEKPGTVFFEHLPKCTSTDHDHLLTVAFGVTNLGNRALVLLGAVPLTNGDGVLQLTGVRLGAGSCAAAGGSEPVRLAPAGNAVVAMTFRVGQECPRNTLIAARVTFDTGAAGIVHADSSELTNLDRLRFAQC